MSLRNAKCFFCNGELEVEETDAISSCKYCGNIIDNSKSIRNYYYNGSHLKTEDEIIQEAENLRNTVTINMVDARVKKDGSGNVHIFTSFTNKSPVPLVSIKAGYCLVDNKGTLVDGTGVKGYWDVDYSSNPVLKNQKVMFGSDVVYLKGKSINLDTVHVLLLYVAATYRNDETVVINSRHTKYIRDDMGTLPDIQLVSEEDRKLQNMQKRKGQPQDKTSGKSWMVYGFLGILFSGFGVHNFYAGNKKRAVIQLCMTLTLIGAPFSGSWAIFEAIGAITRKEVPDYDANPRLF